MSGLLFGLMYFAPTLIGWYRVRQGKRLIYSVRQLFLFNLLIAWTVVGWFLLLANALGFNPVAWIAPRLAKNLPSGQVGARRKERRLLHREPPALSAKVPAQ